MAKQRIPKKPSWAIDRFCVWAAEFSAFLLGGFGINRLDNVITEGTPTELGPFWHATDPIWDSTGERLVILHQQFFLFFFPRFRAKGTVHDGPQSLHHDINSGCLWRDLL